MMKLYPRVNLKALPLLNVLLIQGTCHQHPGNLSITSHQPSVWLSVNFIFLTYKVIREVVDLKLGCTLLVFSQALGLLCFLAVNSIGSAYSACSFSEVSSRKWQKEPEFWSQIDLCLISVLTFLAIGIQPDFLNLTNFQYTQQ